MLNVALRQLHFFGNLQKCFNIFSSSPQRWEILQKHLKCSLQNMSDTRWSSRIECVKPFSMNRVGIKEVKDQRGSKF